jgi:RNA-binding protein 39
MIRASPQSPSTLGALLPPRRHAEHELELQARALEKMDRDQRTVFAYNLSTKADEREIYKFFSKVGVVQDVRVIYDRNTPRSKGMAYVEFAEKDTVAAALATTGQMLRNQVVMVKSSEAEKNIAWEEAQVQKKADAAVPAGDAEADGGVGVGEVGAEVTCKLQVAGLHPNISEDDLRAVFEPFGETDLITIQRDAAGASLGSGNVQYKQAAHAALAITQLNGLELVGQALRVSPAPAEPSDIIATEPGPVVHPEPQYPEP